MYHKSSGDPETVITVQIDGEVHKSDDFVTVLATDLGETLLFFNTDALTLGMSLKMIATEFVKIVRTTCSAEDLQEIIDILGGDFIQLTEGNL